jgi:hypothetical protein
MVIGEGLSFSRWRSFLSFAVGVTVAGVLVGVSSHGGVFTSCFEGRGLSLCLGRVFVRKKSVR